MRERGRYRGNEGVAWAVVGLNNAKSNNKKKNNNSSNS